MIRTIRIGKGKYRTIASAYPIKPNTVVIIGAGVYNEQLLLVSDVEFRLEQGVVIDFNLDGTMPTVTDGNSTVVNCSITGQGTIKRSGSGAPTIIISNGSHVTISGVNIVDANASYGVVRIYNGNVSINTNMKCSGSCVVFFEGALSMTGNYYSDVDYTLWLAGNKGVANIKANITSNRNSAIGVYGGYLTFEGHALSYNLFGFEMGGGWSVTLKNSTIESRSLLGYQEGDAISKYGGIDLFLSNCTMKSTASDAYSLSEQGRATVVNLLSDCFANRGKSPLITLAGAGKVIIN